MKDELLTLLQTKFNLSELEAQKEFRAGRWEASQGRDPREICKDLGIPLKFAELFGHVPRRRSTQPRPRGAQSSLAACI